MKKPSIQVLRACSLTLALLGSAAMVATVAVPDMAFAKGGNEGGNGNGNGGGNGNSNGNGNGKSVEKSSSKVNGGAESTKAAKDKVKAKDKAKAVDKAKVKTKEKTKTKAKKSPVDLGLSPSELGALNAAHANPNALKNASPNSRVGRIAAYRDAVLEGRELETALDEKTLRLETLDPPTRHVSEIEAELEGAGADRTLKAEDVARLEAALAEVDGDDPDLQAELDAARASLAEAEAAEAEMQAELDAAREYAELEAEIAELKARLEAQPELERALLEAAANKPVTDAVEAAVKKLLGL